MSKTSYPRTFCVVVDTPCRTYGEWIKEHDAKVRKDAIDELLSELPHKALISRKYILDAAERIKEQKNEQ